MTEPFPFGAQDEAPVAFEDEPAKDRKPLIALGALAAVALGAGAFFFLGGSDEAEDEFALPTRAARPAAAAAKPATKPAKVPAASTVQLGRNPFKALYVQAAAAPASDATTDSGTTTPTTPTTTGSTGGTVTPIVVVGGGSPTAPQTSPTKAPSKTPATTAPAPARSTVKLTSVSTKSGKPVGTFVLDGKELSGTEGDVLGGKLLVISLQQDSTGGWFANLQVGDGSPFEVHQRQEVVVQ